MVILMDETEYCKQRSGQVMIQEQGTWEKQERILLSCGILLAYIIKFCVRL